MTVEAGAAPRAADLAIAVLTYNNADTVKGVVTAAAEGVAQHFPDLSATLIAADAGSSDASAALVQSAGLPVVALSYEPASAAIRVALRSGKCCATPSAAAVTTSFTVSALL
jgi:molecular chaperone DnaK (HSP70)